jgi:hypothetical protein
MFETLNELIDTSDDDEGMTTTTRCVVVVVFRKFYGVGVNHK